VFTPTNAFAEQALAEVTCATEDGIERTFSIGWDNSNQFFDGRARYLASIVRVDSLMVILFTLKIIFQLIHHCVGITV
jgi:hypothetical protein